MNIMYCLSLAAKSRSEYEGVRNSKIIKLPTIRTLRNYKHYSDVERYILLFDDIKISSNLLFDKHSGE